MKFSFKALLVFLVFMALFLVLRRAGPTGDTILNSIILAVVVAMSVVSVALTIMHGGTYGQDAVAPRWLRRWLLGESGDDDAKRKE
jgi:hypothetical protein